MSGSGVDIGGTRMLLLARGPAGELHQRLGDADADGAIAAARALRRPQ